MNHIDKQILETLEAVPSVQKRVEGRLKSMEIVKNLIQMRAEAGLSQAELAKRMGCTQSRISKIEHSLDDELSIGDLNRYICATGHWSVLTIANTEQTLAGMARHHILLADSLLKKIVELTGRLQKAQQKTDSISLEIVSSLLQTLEQVTEKIPNCPLQNVLNQSYPDIPSSGSLVWNLSRGNKL